MVNTALILGGQGCPKQEIESILALFSARGYSFFETRIFENVDDSRALQAVSSLKEDSETLIVIARKEKLQTLSKSLALFFETPYMQATGAGAGSFTEEGFSLFLLAAESGESGAGFVQNTVLPYLDGRTMHLESRTVLRAVGVDRDEEDELLSTVRKMGGDEVKCSANTQYGDTRFEIVFDGNTPKMLADGILRVLADRLDKKLYAMEDLSLEEQLVRLLKIRGRKISVAESFTGGGVSKRIVSVSGASEVFYEGLNTYSEEAKELRLGVSKYTLHTHGAVSDDTAYEMAAGLLNTKKCDLCIATTGLAGPNSDGSGKPVGLSYIAVGLRENIYVYCHHFEGTRREITETAIHYALFHAYERLKDL